MSTSLNAKPVRLLMHDMAKSFGLKPGDVFARPQAVQWFKQHYPNVKEGTVLAHLIRLSTNVPTRHQYSPKQDGSDDLLFKVDASHFRLYAPGKDPAPVAPAAALPQSDDTGDMEDPGEPIVGSSEFAYEHDLRDYLARNLHLVHPGLKLYEEDGISGVEFPVGGRFIDILAVDDGGNYVVVELKVSKGYDRTVGQLLRYIGWIKKHHAEATKTVRGVIVAKAITDDLRLACADLPQIALYEYSLSVSLKAVVI